MKKRPSVYVYPRKDISSSLVLAVVLWQFSALYKLTFYIISTSPYFALPFLSLGQYPNLKLLALAMSKNVLLFVATAFYDTFCIANKYYLKIVKKILLIIGMHV